MSNEKRSLAYLNGAVFARMLPEQKFEMVKELKDHGHVIAMTGDGINDAPALQLADIGISMGKNATDVARSTAKMILMENNFSGIVSAVFEGRQIFTNLKRSFSYLIAFHAIVIALALFPPFLKWPPILLPIHVILLEMIVHPISAFSFENIKSSKLLKNEHKNLLNRKQVLSALSTGVLVSLVALLVFYFSFAESVPRARSMALAVVFVSNIFLVFREIYPDQNRRFFVTALILLLITILFTMTPFLNSYLHFAPII
jgi:Ca2+-transporting ATPase